MFLKRSALSFLHGAAASVCKKQQWYNLPVAVFLTVNVMLLNPALLKFTVTFFNFFDKCLFAKRNHLLYLGLIS